MGAHRVVFRYSSRQEDEDFGATGFSRVFYPGRPRTMEALFVLTQASTAEGFWCGESTLHVSGLQMSVEGTMV